MTKERELLHRALEALDWVLNFPEGDGYEDLAQEIRAHLAAEEGKQEEESDEDWDPPSFYELGKVRHTYTMVKQRKPLSEEEIEEGWLRDLDSERYWGPFVDGVRWAERHHGIGGGDE